MKKYVFSVKTSVLMKYNFSDNKKRKLNYKCFIQRCFTGAIHAYNLTIRM